MGMMEGTVLSTEEMKEGQQMGTMEETSTEEMKGGIITVLSTEEMKEGIITPAPIPASLMGKVLGRFLILSEMTMTETEIDRAWIVVPMTK
jgi:hypothetical protein